MSEDDVERRLEGLQIRGPDPVFMAALKARIGTELVAAAPLSWWERNRFAVVNGGLAAAIVLVLVIQPGLPHGMPGPDVISDVASVPAVQEAYGPSALAMISRVQQHAGRPKLPEVWPDTPHPTVPKDSRRERHDQTLGFLAAQ